MRLPWLPRKLHARLLLTYLVLTGMGLGGLIVWMGLRLQAAVHERAVHDLHVQALVIANALAEPFEQWRDPTSGDRPAFEALVRSYAHSVGARVTVLSPALHVLVSSDETVPMAVVQASPEMEAAWTGQARQDVRWDAWRQEWRVFVAALLRPEERAFDGIVQLSIPLAPLTREIRRTWLWLLTAGGVILAVTSLVSLGLAYQVTEPIRHLTTVTDAIAGGKLEQRVTPAGPDEVARLGRTLNRMAAYVQGMLARQQAFVAHAAHELRSPLASLRLRLEMVQCHGPTNLDLTQRYLQQMEHDVDHLQRLVDHLLALASLDEGVVPALTPVDLAPLLHELAEALTPLAQAAGVRVRVDVPAHLPAVLANADAIRMIVRNLLDNAITYTPPSGLVTLQATIADHPGETARARAQDVQPSSLVVHVMDTGPGIPPDHLPHIFERFYRVDTARARRRGGAGLGLALVRAATEAQGGSVTVASTMDVGSTFTVRLPLAPAIVGSGQTHGRA
jgi:signal transduction histidine kinase